LPLVEARHGSKALLKLGYNAFMLVSVAMVLRHG